MEQGYLALVLHAHLPFVRHPESENYLEEKWLFEAITETYIPLLQVYERLIDDGVNFRITMSMSPTLISMLSDELLQNRYLKHIERLIDLAQLEVCRTKETAEFQLLAQRYLQHFTDTRNYFIRQQCDLIGAFRSIQDQGKLDIITSAATHAFLPLVMTEEAQRAQLCTAVQLHEKHFGRRPTGIWLPECGFTPGLDRLLQECGIKFFFTDAHAFASAEPRPVFGTLSPVLSPGGAAAFPRDQESSAQVWSSHEGYPGDPVYREYYRDIGYDLDLETIKPFIHPDGIRVNTGIKYFRITGSTDQKKPYEPELARTKAAEHAQQFIHNRCRQIEYWSQQMGRKAIVVAPYDAELFGHWWYEGPIFLEMVLRELDQEQQSVRAITPADYLQLYNDYQVCHLPMSSWGRGGYADVWMRSENDWIYPALHTAETRMAVLAGQYCCPTVLERRALNQAARELMLAQSSDWAFIMDNKTMVDYAIMRTKLHINRFTQLFNMLRSGVIDERWLQSVEDADNLFPDIDYSLYQTHGKWMGEVGTQRRPQVLMLSWEFPPMTVGGLSRHVYDLSRSLVRIGWDVHVVTSEYGDCASYEKVEGVHVHRVQVRQPDGGEFTDWAFQLNLMMIEASRKLIEKGLRFDLVHAHDWLVCYTARIVKEQYGLPLVATIHATEHGRNHGIYTDLQRYISSLEWKLTYEAQQVIVCSAYMQREVEMVFQLPSEKIHVIPNGVDPCLLAPAAAEPESGTLGFGDLDCKQAYALPHERIVLYVGRLVREKGVHTLLAAAPSILAEQPDVKFVICGKGPAMQELIQQAETLGIRNKVHFTGFISDEERNTLFHIAEAAVFPSLYEPFGIVALEAMAAGTPVVVSDVGGLADVVEHTHNGLKMYANDANSLSMQVRDLLRNPRWGKQLAATAFTELAKYDWKRIAEQTIGVYEMAARDSIVGRVGSDESSDYGRRQRHTAPALDVPHAETDGAAVGPSLHGIYD